jgi:hypothetical protein
MKTLLFTNTFFEEELSNTSSFSLTELLQKHPLYIQLQYLSCFLSSSSEIPLLSAAPDPTYLQHLENIGIAPSSFALLTEAPTSSTLCSWGFSKSLSKWAQEKNCSYLHPDPSIIYKIQSKEFSFLTFPQPKSSQKITSSQNLISWWNSFSGPKVLKTLFGASGRGHFVSSGDALDLPKALSFFAKHQDKSPALIAQPWLTRVFDFSSQWDIARDGTVSYLGSTVCENTLRGTYQKSITGKESLLFHKYFPYFEEHVSYAQKALSLLKSLSFFGNIGFDAFLYEDPVTNLLTLFPIVEINARKTMGWAAVQLLQKLSLSSNTLLSIHYGAMKKSPYGLLPYSHQEKIFPKQLFFDTNLVCI